MVEMTTRAVGSMRFDFKSWQPYSSVNLRPSPGTENRSNSPAVCLPRLARSTRNSTRCAPPWRMSRHEAFAAVYVLPDPVAIWISDLGRSCARDFSSSTIARVWAGHRAVESTSGRWCRRPRSVGATGFCVQSLSQRANVSGRCTKNTSRLRAIGSRPLVKRVSMPVDSYKNGSGRMGAVTCGGRPAAYFADCGSTPVSVTPSFFASSAPTACRSTNSK